MGGQQTPGPWDTPGHQPALCLMLVLSPNAAVQMTGWNTSPGDRHLVQSLEPPGWHWGHPGCQEGLCCHHPGGHLLATHNRKGPSAAAALLGTFLVPSFQAPRLDGISKPGASGRSLRHYSGPLLRFWLFRQRSRSLPNPGTARERSELDPKSGQPPRATYPYTGHTHQTHVHPLSVKDSNHQHSCRPRCPTHCLQSACVICLISQALLSPEGGISTPTRMKAPYRSLRWPRKYKCSSACLSIGKKFLTRFSHPSTNQTWPCLASEVRQEHPRSNTRAWTLHRWCKHAPPG